MAGSSFFGAGNLVGQEPWALRGENDGRIGVLEADSGWLTPTFTNSWVNYDPTTWTVAQYRKKSGVVYLEGLIKNGTVGLSAFTLPAGYRPLKNLIFAVIDGLNTGQRLDVNSNGTVVPDSGNNGYFSLNCCFIAEA